jgi:dienelactone hydrolase
MYVPSQRMSFPFDVSADALVVVRLFRHHGWAAARGDLSNEENKKECEDVYSRVAAFFKSVQKD